MERYIVVKSQIDGDDITSEEFTDYPEALRCVGLDENKAVMVKVRSPDPNTTVEIEWFT